jgi:hypothetical protein
VDPPRHTICIKASDLKWTKGKEEDVRLNRPTSDILYATCGEAHVRTSGNKMYSPLLKLYHNRPMMINENIDVKSGIANGMMCAFKNVVLKKGIEFSNLERIQIDGYFVYCASVTQIEHLNLQDMDGDGQMFRLEPMKKTVKVHFPLPIYGNVLRWTPRFYRKLKMCQFPLNAGNARTIHKLQGRSIENIVVSSWDYKGNWIYVALSRVKTLKGLFIRLPLNFAKCHGMSHELRVFMAKMRLLRAELPDTYNWH